MSYPQQVQLILARLLLPRRLLLLLVVVLISQQEMVFKVTPPLSSRCYRGTNKKAKSSQRQSWSQNHFRVPGRL